MSNNKPTQADLIDFIRNPDTINKAVEGSMEKRSAMSDKTTDTSDWLDDLLNEFMEYTYKYAKGDIAMSENPPLLLARKAKQAIQQHEQQAIAKRELQMLKWASGTLKHNSYEDTMTMLENGMTARRLYLSQSQEKEQK